MMMKTRLFCLCVCLLLSPVSFAKTTIRLGVQNNGTLAWELTALAADNDIELDIHPIATPEAGKAALQTGEVDMIVADWIWTARQREQGEDFTFYPYSDIAGALIVPKDSPIQTIQDLAGKRLGIAGGEQDKNWLLLQALAQQNALNLNQSVNKTFGKPADINEQLKQQQLDAALTYWHFAAQLETQGYRQVIDDKTILKQLNIPENIPNLGYVFKHSWGMVHQDALNSFFKHTQQARKQLCTDDKAWQKVLPLIKTDNAELQTLLRQRFCEGNIDIQWGDKEQQAAVKVYGLLKSLGHEAVKLTDLPKETFWSDYLQ